MEPTRSFLTPRTAKIAAWSSVIALALCTFIVLTREVLARRGAIEMDVAILRWVAERRTPFLTKRMVDLTALGSPTLVAVFTAATFAILSVRKDRRSLAHLFVASLGTWALTSLTKGIIERTRPTEVSHLVEVAGFSYPSGHTLSVTALYLTIVLIATADIRSGAVKAVLVGLATALILMVGLSRIYLGVHYPSDVLSGMSLGVSWASSLGAAVAVISARRRHTQT
jgi:undecaprenyl-diphosphatase